MNLTAEPLAEHVRAVCLLTRAENFENLLELSVNPNLYEVSGTEPLRFPIPFLS
jgi:hypothetical protein